MITLNKLRMFYFFCADRKAVNNYLQFKDIINITDDFDDDVQLISHKPNAISLEIGLY